MYIEILTVVFLLLAGVLAGVLFSVEVAIVPMVCALPGERYVQVHRLLDARFDPLMPRMNKVSLAVCAALVIFADGVGARVVFGLAGLCIVGVAVVSEAFNVRMNRDIDTWDPGEPPAGWPVVRARWAAANRVRTVLAGAGFCLAVAAATTPW